MTHNVFLHGRLSTNSCFKLKNSPRLVVGRPGEEDGSTLVSNVVAEYNDPVLGEEKSQTLLLERELENGLEREKNAFFREKFPSGRSQK